jgi:D-arabinose 1-dehydrogenase-like Zn-dependent alcohol dehydrogenase
MYVKREAMTSRYFKHHHLMSSAIVSDSPPSEIMHNPVGVMEPTIGEPQLGGGAFVLSPSGEAIEALCMACADQTCDFKPTRLQRRAPSEFDVVVDIKFCGVCHSDVTIATGQMKGLGTSPQFPCVPGHELAGVCVFVGSAVTKFRVGQQVGVGYFLDSCLECVECKAGNEQKCKKQVTPTLCAPDKHGRAAVYPPGSQTLGGFTKTMVVHERFGILIPEKYPLKMAGPVMCAGITVFDPMRAKGIKAGDHVGIVGLGGLGQMGIKIAKAMGCTVTVVSRGESKREFATKCGADTYLASSDAGLMAQGKDTLDILINTIPAQHDYMLYQPLLRKKNRNATQFLLGLHSDMVAAFVADAIKGGKSRVAGSGVGSIASLQGLINLCAEKEIYPEIELCSVSELNAIYEKLEGSNDTGLRYVLDIEGTLKEDTECNAPPPNLAPEQRHPISMGGICASLCKMLCCCRA